jgi:hypothetical protein
MTRLLHTNYTRDLMAMAIEALAEWAKLRGVDAPGGTVETHCMPVYQAKTETTLTEEKLTMPVVYLSKEELLTLYPRPRKDAPMYLTEDETTEVQRNRITKRSEQEIWFRANGHYDWADRCRDNTDILVRGGEIQRRRGGTRDDE